MKKQVKIWFSSLAPAISAQLKRQNLGADNSEMLDKLNHALNMVHVHGLISGLTYSRACKRFMRLIVTKVKSKNLREAQAVKDTEGLA